MNTKLVTLLVILITLTSFLPGCTKYKYTSPKADETGWSEEGVEELSRAINRFAINLYLNISEKENIFFSPYSIFSAFALLYEGARGDTARELEKVFFFPNDQTVRRPNFARIYNLINNNSRYFDLHTANALWIQKNYPILQDYLQVIETYYGGEAFNVDFSGATEQTRELINEWIEHQTNYTIKDFFPPNSIDPLTRLVLTNAIYFKGIWLKQFDENETTEDIFWIDNDTTVKIQMMKVYDFFNYTETDDLQIIELPYKGKRICMLVLLPKRNIEQIEDNLTINSLNSWVENLTEQRIEVYLPKINLSTEYSLKEILESMGLHSIFCPGEADFSGIDGTKNLFVDEAIHKAFIKIDEKGTEASAATGIIMPISLPTIFRADHPFIFLILDKETDIILFMGKIVNPAE